MIVYPKNPDLIEDANKLIFDVIEYRVDPKEYRILNYIFIATTYIQQCLVFDSSSKIIDGFIVNRLDEFKYNGYSFYDLLTKSIVFDEDEKFNDIMKEIK